MTQGRRALLVIGGILVAAIVAIRILQGLAGNPAGPTSSSYATAPTGLAAYAELVERAGHDVVRLRDAPAKATLDPATTLVILDPEAVTSRDARALRTFVAGGGRLVTGAARPEPWLDVVIDRPPRWSAAGIRIAHAAALAPVQTVRSAGEGSWSESGSATPVLGGPHRVLLVRTRLGRGRVDLLADPSPLQNRLLDRADNAALGLSLAGPRRRGVVFVESVHGYGRATGYAAIPRRWWWTLGGLLLAAATYMVARGRRLGPPEREGRELAPPRREYVEAMAGLLARTKRPAEAVEPVRTAARELLAQRTGAPSPELGRALGLSDEELEAVLGEGPVDVLAAGRALAKLEAAG